MIRIQSENDFLKLFREIDREQVYLPSEFKFPLAVRDYLAWPEPGGHRIYLVVANPNGSGAVGATFKRTSASGENVVQMCSWCHTVRGGDSVGLLSVQVDKRKRIGIHVCRDLNCRENILSTPGVNDLRESVDVYERLSRVQTRMQDFIRSNLL